jgi:hypothetical protein
VVIGYRLRSSQNPTDPKRIWHAIVEDVTRSRSNELVGCCLVRALDPGYEDMTEYVLFDQIIEVQPATTGAAMPLT